MEKTSFEHDKDLQDLDFELALTTLASNPAFKPPEGFFELNLTSVKTILESCPREICVEFAVGEAKLVVPDFKKVVGTVEAWEAAGKSIRLAASINDVAMHAAIGSATSTHAACAWAARGEHGDELRCARAADIAAKLAAASINMKFEDQLERLFDIIRKKENDQNL